jgi:5-methylcytosine-specific restriction enzyme subunit McrC
VIATTGQAPSAAETPARVSGIPIRNVWHMLLYAWNELPVNRHSNVDVDQSPSLDALLATMLASLMKQRLRIGLGRSYIDERQLLRGIRGRIDFTESVTKLAFENGKAYCKYQSFTRNAPKNQIVRSTLTRLVQTGDFGPDKARAEELRQSLRRLVRDLDGVDVIEVTAAFIRRQNLGRNDADYRLMLAICDLVHQRQMPTEQAGSRTLLGLDRDTLTLYKIFERFVANFYRFQLRKWTVRVQHTLHWHTTKTSEFLPAMVADLLLENRDDGQSIVLDTKFTPNCLAQGRSDKLVFDSSHLYQIYAYLRSQEHLSEKLRFASGILLYPTVQWALSERIELQGHLIRLETIDLSKLWKTIEEKLVELIPGKSVSASQDLELTQP